MMYKVFLKYPEALRPAFPRLKEKLEDPDPGTTSKKPSLIFCTVYFFRCAIGSGERGLRVGPKESEKLLEFSTGFLQTDDDQHK